MNRTIEKPRFLCAFPGTGVAFCGKEYAFYKKHIEKFERLFAYVTPIAGITPNDVFDASKEFHSELNSQLITYLYSCAMWDVVREVVEPVAVTGYSMGIYAALYAAGVITFKQGVGIISRALHHMEEIASRDSYGMLAIVGLCRQECLDIIGKHSPCEVMLVNQNNQTSFVFSGLADKLEKCARIANDRGAYKTVMLPVKIPYHHPVLKGASVRMYKEIGDNRWRRANLPVVSAINRCMVLGSGELKKLVAENLSTPINWYTVIESIQENCYGIIECGPGISLTQMGRFILPGKPYVNVKNIGRRLGV
ncbi:MAG: ACP S-malonyltransferase [Chitinispirillaceae bacterium]